MCLFLFFKIRLSCLIATLREKWWSIQHYGHSFKTSLIEQIQRRILKCNTVHYPYKLEGSFFNLTKPAKFRTVQTLSVETIVTIFHESTHWSSGQWANIRNFESLSLTVEILYQKKYYIKYCHGKFVHLPPEIIKIL